MSELHVVHTADLDSATIHAVRDLLEDAFDGDFSDDDWDHSLGGLHVLVWQESGLVGHASVIQRRLLHGGRAWRTGYVEGVGVRADARRQGHGASMMEAIERVVRHAYDLGALATTDEAADFYAGRGWRQWRGPTSVLTPSGVTRTEGDDGGVYVLPVSAALDLSGELTCDWRDGEVW